MTAPLFTTVWELPVAMRAATQSTFYLSQDAFDNPSPWTQERTPYGPFVQYHIADISPPPARANATREGEITWRDWAGFMTRLRGTSGLLRVVDYFRVRPRYDHANAGATTRWSNGELWSDGKPWVTGALPPFVTLDENVPAEADNFVLRGLPANKSDVLSPNDLIELRPNGVPTPYGNLYEVVHAAKTNSAGKTRVYVQPNVRESFVAGDMAVLRYPTLVARLADKSQGIVTRVQAGGRGTLGFKLIEKMRDV